MLFNSLEFLLFLPVVFLIYWYIGTGQHLRNAIVVAASYVFYGWWDWRFLALLVLTTASSYGAGLLLESQSSPRARRATLWANIVLNLGILIGFKYFNFFADNLLTLLGAAGYHPGWVTLNVVLPVGISFYTFQAMGYVIDVYHRRTGASHNAVAYFAYLSFFPQLVAGPIERAGDLLPQFERNRQFDYGAAVDGMRQMLWGFFKKIVLADNCAMIVNNVWACHDEQGAAMIVLAAVLFSLQIYGDFSGYSDIAIGCARLFGIRLSRNFAYPYFSHNIREFWQRWHMSLMRWFTTYVYIPLGGSRCSTPRLVSNIMTVFLLSGLWHGANWTFVVWGAYHGVLVALYRLVRPALTLSSRWWRMVSIVCTFAVATIGWIIFRAPTLSDAVAFMVGIFHAGGTSALHSMAMLMSIAVSGTAAVIVFAAEWRAMRLGGEHALCSMHGTVMRRTIYIALAMACLLLGGTQSEFIYFQF